MILSERNRQGKYGTKMETYANRYTFACRGSIDYLKKVTEKNRGWKLTKRKKLPNKYHRFLWSVQKRYEGKT